jgi:hypothetical protein
MSLKIVHLPILMNAYGGTGIREFEYKSLDLKRVSPHSSSIRPFSISLKVTRRNLI